MNLLPRVVRNRQSPQAQSRARFCRSDRTGPAEAIEVYAMRAGLVAPPAAPAGVVPGRLTVATAIDKYLDFIEHHRAARTYLAYRYTLDTSLRIAAAARAWTMSRAMTF
jgi:hypothetical protein